MEFPSGARMVIISPDEPAPKEDEIMAKKPRLVVVAETPTGRNSHFNDTRSGETISRAEAVRRIESGQYPDYHVREVNGVKTPVSNPDGKGGKNNLG